MCLGASRRTRLATIEGAIFLGVFALYAAALPLGLARVVSAAAVWQGQDLRAVQAGPQDPLWVLLVRAFAFLPLGDLATRANLAGALAVTAAAVLLWRCACEAVRPLRPPTRARQGQTEVEVDAAAALSGVVLFAVSLGVFQVATLAGGGGACLAYLAAMWWLMLRVYRKPDVAQTGIAISLLAGLALGMEPFVAPLVWPGAAAVAFRALRRGARWPVLAPAAFVAGTGLALFSVAAADGPRGLGELLESRLVPWRIPTGVFAGDFAREIGSQVGVVGALLACVGLVILAMRAPVVCGLVLWTLAVALWIPSVSAAPMAIAACTLPITAGTAHLARKLGRARLAAIAALTIISAVAPALDGGAARWRADLSLPARLLDRALAMAPLRSSVDPGSALMHGLFRYSEGIGMRPDLTIRAQPSK